MTMRWWWKSRVLQRRCQCELRMLQTASTSITFFFSFFNFSKSACFHIYLAVHGPKVCSLERTMNSLSGLSKFAAAVSLRFVSSKECEKHPRLRIWWHDDLFVQVFIVLMSQRNFENSHSRYHQNVCTQLCNRRAISLRDSNLKTKQYLFSHVTSFA